MSDLKNAAPDILEVLEKNLDNLEILERMENHPAMKAQYKKLLEQTKAAIKKLEAIKVE